MTPTSQKATFAVLGAGSWGATLGNMLQGAGHDVRIWAYLQEIIDDLRENGHPPGVPELQLSDEVTLTTDLEEAHRGADAAIMVVPSQAVEEVAGQIAALDESIRPRLVILASKGIDLKRLMPLHQVIEETIPGATAAVVSGPCIAREVAQQIPTSVVASCCENEISGRLQHWFNTPRFRVYRQHDTIGVELGGALKNVIAIAAGVSDGLGFGANSKSALLTRGLAEMTRIATIMGAEATTLAGLAGLGDLAVTCFSPHSRNRRFGEAIGRRTPPNEAIKQIGEVVEGIPTSQAVLRIAQEKGFEAPIAEAVHNMTNGQWTPEEALENLMSRELKEEFES